MAGSAPARWTRVFCALVLVWEPVSLALLASARVGSIADRPAALAILAARVVSAALGVAAGIALWNARPGGATLAKTYLVLSSIVAVITLTTSSFPTNLMPGSATPIAVAILVQNAAWFVYFAKSSRPT